MFEERYKKMQLEQRNFKLKYGKELIAASEILEDCTMYPPEDILELNTLTNNLHSDESLFEALKERLYTMKKLPDAPERIYLWSDGNMPEMTEYTDNSEYQFNHNPGFKPYMLEMLLPDDVTPKGAVIMIPGGDQGASTVNGGYACSKDFNALGYQCFILHNRVFANPWCGQEAGVDVARAIRMIRANAKKYRIDPNTIAVCGYSNGGITGEMCIRYASGKQTVKQHFPNYVPDELDDIYGAPDTFLCIYGPRFKDMDFDFTEVNYPPTFFAVGRKDNAMDNLNATVPTLLAHGVPFEVHTFAGVPHGVAGRHYTNGKVQYPSWELWVPLADAFMQDVYAST